MARSVSALVSRIGPKFNPPNAKSSMAMRTFIETACPP